MITKKESWDLFFDGKIGQGAHHFYLMLFWRADKTEGSLCGINARMLSWWGKVSIPTVRRHLKTLLELDLISYEARGKHWDLYLQKGDHPRSPKEPRTLITGDHPDQVSDHLSDHPRSPYPDHPRSGSTPQHPQNKEEKEPSRACGRAPRSEIREEDPSTPKVERISSFQQGRTRAQTGEGLTPSALDGQGAPLPCAKTKGGEDKEEGQGRQAPTTTPEELQAKWDEGGEPLSREEAQAKFKEAQAAIAKVASASQWPEGVT